MLGSTALQPYGGGGKMAQTMVGAIDPYWGSLHCVCALMVPPHPDIYLGTGYRTVGARCSRDNLNRCVFDFF